MKVEEKIYWSWFSYNEIRSMSIRINLEWNLTEEQKKSLESYACKKMIVWK